MPSLPLLLLLLAQAALGTVHFDYDRCSAKAGPKDGWEGFCPKQLEGSPIHLCGAQLYPNAPTLLATNYAVVRNVSIFNPGHTVQLKVMPGGNPMLDAGELPAIVGRSNSSKDTWRMEQIHFHWGREGSITEGSEHVMEGKAFPFEAHLVHFNSRYQSVADAVGSGNSDALLVVGVFFQIGKSDVDIITKVAKEADEATETPTRLQSPVTLSDLFTGDGEYYFYRGSLTTPTCNPVVTWVVMKEPKTMRASTLEFIKDTMAVPTTEDIAVHGNFRPLQRMNGRPLYTSSEGSARCTVYAEAPWACEGVDKSALAGSSAVGSPGPSVVIALLLPVLLLAAAHL